VELTMPNPIPKDRTKVASKSPIVEPRTQSTPVPIIQKRKPLEISNVELTPDGLIFYFDDGSTKNVGKIGNPGIADAKIMSNGNLKLILTNGHRIVAGNVMAQNGEDGSGFVWQGSYRIGLTYYGQLDNPAGNLADVVEFKGSTYVCTGKTIQPPPGSTWQLMAQKGADGQSIQSVYVSAIPGGGSGSVDLSPYALLDGSAPFTGIVAAPDYQLPAGALSSGSISRTVADRLGDILSIRDFGLVADSAPAAAANTVKMHAALAAAAGKTLRCNIQGTIYLSMTSFADTLTPAAGTTLDFDPGCILRWDTQYPLFLLEQPNISLLGPNLRCGYTRTETYLSATDIRPFLGVDLSPLGSDNSTRVNAWTGIFINGGAQNFRIVNPNFQAVTQTHLGCIYAWITALEDTNDVLPSGLIEGGYISDFVQGILGRIDKPTVRNVRFGRFTQFISSQIPAGHAIYIAYDGTAGQTLMSKGVFENLHDEGTYLDGWAKGTGAYRGEVIQTSLLTANYSSLKIYTAAQAAALGDLANGDWFRPVYGRLAQDLSASMIGITSTGRDDIVRYEGSSTWSEQTVDWNLESFKFRGMTDSIIRGLSSNRPHGLISGGDYCARTHLSGLKYFNDDVGVPRSYMLAWQDENAGVNHAMISDVSIVRGPSSWPLVVLGSKTAGILSEKNTINGMYIETDIGPLDNDFNDFMLKLYLCGSSITGLRLRLHNRAVQTLEGVKLIELTSYITAPYDTSKSLLVRGSIEGLTLPLLYNTAATNWAAENIWFSGVMSMTTASSGTSIPASSEMMIFVGQHTAARTYTLRNPQFDGQKLTLIASVDASAVAHNFDSAYQLNGVDDTRYTVTGTLAKVRLDLIGAGSEWIVGYKDVAYV
jgi:hypothetical protein